MQGLLFVCEVSPLFAAFYDGQLLNVLALYVEDWDLVARWGLGGIGEEERKGDGFSIMGTDDYFFIQKVFICAFQEVLDLPMYDKCVYRSL